MTSGMNRRHVDGYLHAFQSTCEVYLSLKEYRHRSVVKKHLNILVWCYIQSCRSAGLEPTFQEIFPSLVRIRYFPVREFLSVLLPANLVAVLRGVKGELRAVGAFRRRT
jgi:hypothetical protein